MSGIGYIPRELVSIICNGNPRAIDAFETQVRAIKDTSKAVEQGTAETARMKDAAVLLLSTNAEFENERIVTAGDGISLSDENGRFTIATQNTPNVSGGFSCNLIVSSDTNVALPVTGRLATVSNSETLSNKTISAPLLSDIGDYADDTAAASGGVPVGGVYRDGNKLRVRVA